MTDTTGRYPQWTAAIGIFCALLLFNRAHITSVDEGHVYQTTRSLVERRSWQLYEPLNERRYSRYSPLPSLMAVPFELAGRGIARAIGGADWQEDAAARRLHDAVLFGIGPVLAMLTSVFVAVSARQFGMSPASSLFGMLAYGLGSLALPYAGSLYVQPVAAFWVAATVAAVATGRPVGSSGLCWAAALWTRLDLALLTPLFMLLTQSRRAWMELATGLLLGVVLTIVTNVLRGDPWLAGGYAGETFLSSPFVGLYGVLLSAGKGLVWFAPLCAFGLAWGLVRTGGKLLPVAVAAAAYTLVVACWWTWHGGYCWGPRLLLPVLPLTCVLLADAWEQVGPPARRVLLVILAYSVLLQIAASGAHPFAERTGPGAELATEAEHLFIPPLSVLAVPHPGKPDWWWVDLLSQEERQTAAIAVIVAVALAAGMVLVAPAARTLVQEARPIRRMSPWSSLGILLVLVGLSARPTAEGIAQWRRGAPPAQCTAVNVYVPVHGTYDVWLRLVAGPAEVTVNGHPVRLVPAAGQWLRFTTQLRAGTVVRLAHARGIRPPVLWRTPGEALYKQPVPAPYVSYDSGPASPHWLRGWYEYGWLCSLLGLYLIAGRGSAARSGSCSVPGNNRE